MNFLENEILFFLEQDLQKKCQEEGWNEHCDQELRTYRQNLLKAKEGSLSLQEVISSHHYLFGERGPLHLEKALQKVFSKKEFASLNLAVDTFPRMYRKLPRVRRDGEVRIKKDFAHLPSLKKCGAAKALFSLYSKVIPPKNTKIAILTWVQPDGLGDFFAAIESAKILSQALPDLQLELWMISRLKLPSIKELSIRHISDTEDLALENFKELRNVDLILGIPTVHPKMTEIRETVAKVSSAMPLPIWECVGQYGFLESDWFHPSSGNHSLGLHFLEKGIFIRKGNKLSLAVLENKTLAEMLFQTSSPTRREIKRYLSERTFFLAYLHSSQGIFVYLTAILKSLENATKDIDICLPDPARVYAFYQSRLHAKKDFLENTYGVGSVILQLKEHTIEWETGQKGKTLRLLCPEGLSSEDYQRLLAFSEDFTAVRGDQSFSEAVSLQKGFFYEPREHASYFTQDLVLLAEKRIAKYPAALRIIELSLKFLEHIVSEKKGDWIEEVHLEGERIELLEIGEKMGIFLQDPDAVSGLKKLSKILAKELSCNSFLIHLVQRALYHHKNPEAQKEEEEQMEKFALGYATLAGALSQIRKSLHGIN